MIVVQLILHGLLAVALLGAVTHQLIALLFRLPAGSTHFLARYTAVRPERFTHAIVVLYIVVLSLGSTVYPAYRIDVRIPFEELGLAWAVGLFELKEHLAAVGLGTLPLYALLWRPAFLQSHLRDRRAITVFIGAVVWLDFIVGHILNNIRGLT